MQDLGTRPLTGWGRTAPTVAALRRPEDDADVVDAVLHAGPRGLVARGLGRSYGDPAQNGGGVVLDMTGRDRVLQVDLETGVVQVEAGASLEQLITLLLPLGLLVPVSPGTRQVTVGGAIAADIHGKNHHVAGSFCDHVLALDLVTADGQVRTVTPERDPDLFWGTAGGMGLTGVVLRATVRMTKVETSAFVVDTERARDLDDLLARLGEGDERYTYSVAWIDCLARGARLGRSVLTRGWSARVDQLPPRARREPLAFRSTQVATAPDVFPPGLLNRATVAAFNEVWYRKAPVERRGEVQGLSPFFHPLDLVGQWNRVYGPRGFVQYQFVVPVHAVDAVRACVERLSAAGAASFLAVLKRFGQGNGGFLSFPEPGWTLALDIPVPARPDGSLSALLDDLDRVVLDAGGRLYLAKDSRVPADVLARMYPRLQRFRDLRDRIDPGRTFTSDLARRLDL